MPFGAKFEKNTFAVRMYFTALVSTQNIRNKILEYGYIEFWKYFW